MASSSSHGAAWACSTASSARRTRWCSTAAAACGWPTAATTASRFSIRTEPIPLRLENPKIGGVDDAEIVGDRIAEDCPVFRYLLAQEMQNRSAELVVGRVAAVVGYVPMHQSP